MWISFIVIACQNTEEKTTVEKKSISTQSVVKNQSPSQKTIPSKVTTPSKSRFDGDHIMTPLDVARFQPQEIPFIRNEIFARHGRSFKTPRYAEHFEKQSWYQSDPNYSDDKLTKNDRKNINLLQSFEKKASQKDFVSIGEFWYSGSNNGEDSRIVIPIDQKTLAIHDGYDMYHSNPTNVSYILQGDWIITYTDNLDRKKSTYTLWKYNLKDATILEKHEHKSAL